ncbi:MAG TPA: TfoX/Sxy family protein [Longimicrobiaceae bacterium]|nr:TfoX/Sxy family protein [Longimicrobiaceae bacterium]
MPVSPEYREFVLEQLARVTAVTARSMFGGVGIYADGLFFALMDDDALYLKVDDSNRGDFEAAGTGPFNPFDDPAQVMQYYELPAELLEDPDRLRPWVEKAVDVARAARKRKKR